MQIYATNQLKAGLGRPSNVSDIGSCVVTRVMMQSSQGRTGLEGRIPQRFTVIRGCFAALDNVSSKVLMRIDWGILITDLNLKYLTIHFINHQY